MAIDKLKDSSAERLLPTDQSDFSFYEQFCNERNGSARKAGILSDEAYEEIIEDPSTLYMIVGEVRVPVLVDIKHGASLGYDIKRSRELAGSNNSVSVLSVPIGDLEPEFQADAIKVVGRSGERSIFFADNEGRDLAVLQQGLEAEGAKPIEQPLVDERARPGYEQASLSLYAMDLVATGEVGEQPRKKGLDIVRRHFEEDTLPTISDPGNAVLIRSGESFSDSELEDLWKLYEDRFQFLGEQHPISMEDSKKDFLELFAHPDVLSVVKYTDNKPVCFTFFSENISRMSWLNASFFEKDKATLDPSQTTIFFPGIVASKESRGQNASEVISAFADEVARTQTSFRLYFENTNLSERYIPTIVYRASIGHDEYSLSEARKLDETQYRLLHVD